MSITNGHWKKQDNQAVLEKAGGLRGPANRNQNRIKTLSVEALELAD
jgi:hypothetical protein